MKLLGMPSQLSLERSECQVWCAGLIGRPELETEGALAGFVQLQRSDPRNHGVDPLERTLREHLVSLTDATMHLFLGIR